MENITRFSFMEQDRPVLEARLLGGRDFPEAEGRAYIYYLPNGIYVQADFTRLPASSDFAFHVHEGFLCDAPGEKVLLLPDVFSDENGSASAQVYLDRANAAQIAGRPIVIHLKRGSEEVTVACGLLGRIL